MVIRRRRTGTNLDLPNILSGVPAAWAGEAENLHRLFAFGGEGPCP